MQAAGVAVAFKNLLGELERTDDQVFSIADHSLHVSSKLVETLQNQGVARWRTEFLPTFRYRVIGR